MAGAPSPKARARCTSPRSGSLAAGDPEVRAQVHPQQVHPRPQQVQPEQVHPEEVPPLFRRLPVVNDLRVKLAFVGLFVVLSMGLEAMPPLPPWLAQVHILDAMCSCDLPVYANASNATVCRSILRTAHLHAVQTSTDSTSTDIGCSQVELNKIIEKLKLHGMSQVAWIIHWGKKGMPIFVVSLAIVLALRIAKPPPSWRAHLPPRLVRIMVFFGLMEETAAFEPCLRSRWVPETSPETYFSCLAMLVALGMVVFMASVNARSVQARETSTTIKVGSKRHTKMWMSRLLLSAVALTSASAEHTSENYLVPVLKYAQFHYHDAPPPCSAYCGETVARCEQPGFFTTTVYWYWHDPDTPQRVCKTFKLDIPSAIYQKVVDGVFYADAGLLAYNVVALSSAVGTAALTKNPWPVLSFLAPSLFETAVVWKVSSDNAQKIAEMNLLDGGKKYLGAHGEPIPQET